MVAITMGWVILVDPGLPEDEDPRTGKAFPSVRMQSTADLAWSDTLPGAGHPRLVNFWSAKCESCVAMLKVLKRIADERAGEHLEVMLLAEEDTDKLRTFGPLRDSGLRSWHVQEADVEIPFFRDPASRQREYPTSYFVDKDGVVKRILKGTRYQRQILAAVDHFIFDLP